MTVQLDVGKYNKLPHFAVVGDPQEFYLWVNEDGRGSASRWFKGRSAFKSFNALRGLHRKDRAGFCAEVKRLHTEHPVLR